MKNLETEYRKSQQEQVPDLWSRIEAALPEKAPQAVQPAQSSQGVQPAQIPQVAQSAQTPKKKIIGFVRFTRIAAAVLVMAAVIPGAWFLMNRGKDLAKSESIVMDTTGNCESEADMAANNEAAKDMAANNEAAMDMAGSSEAAMDVAGNSEAAMDVAGNSETAKDTAGDSDALIDMAVSEELPVNSVSEITADMTVEEIISANRQTVYYLRDRNGQIYSVAFAVLAEGGADENGIAPEETIGLQVGERYLFTLQAVDGKDWDYEICNIE